jgi:Methyltransferase domain
MRPCPICGKNSSIRVGELTNTFNGSMSCKSYDLAHCRECDVVYLSPLPPQADLDQIYNCLQFDYYTEESIPPIVEFYRRRMKALCKALGNPAQLSVLEIGAGPAWISRAAKTIRPDALTVGQDVSSEMAEKCPWVDQYLVGSTDAPEIDQMGPYDVISLTHVIEHLIDPVAMLRRLKPLSRGLIFITAPHRPVAWKGSIEEWRNYSYNHVPAHLQYFSKRGMKSAAQHSGLRIRHWDASGEAGQTFEAWLERPEAPTSARGRLALFLREHLGEHRTSGMFYAGLVCLAFVPL